MNDKEILKEVREFAKGIIEDFPEGDKTSKFKCFVVCAPLDGYLGFLGLKCSLVRGEVHGDDHYWIDLGDGRIIDPTADQFRKPDGGKMPRTYLGPKPDWYKVLPRFEPSPLACPRQKSSNPSCA